MIFSVAIVFIDGIVVAPDIQIYYTSTVDGRSPPTAYWEQ